MDASAAFPPPPSPSSNPPCPPCRQSSSLLQLDCFAPSDGFFVDELLDFPFDDDVSCLALDDGSSGSPPPHSMELTVCGASTNSLSGLSPRAAAGESVDGEGIGQPSVSELCVPSDELANQLEWLSAFVEDSSYAADTTLAPLVSCSDLSACMLESSSDEPRTREAFQSPSPVSVLEQAGGTFSGRAWCLSPFFTVPGRARSKRSRTGGRVWSLDTLIPISLDNKLVSRDNMLTDCSGESSLSSPLQEGDVPSIRPSKKTKKASAAVKSVDTAQPRKCAHCLVQKTPQWRAGPMGPKTLCNACGVRYKSGRLVPEYRPACSPSFVSEVHSNSHKRILEMRRLKEFEAWEGHRPSGQHLGCKREVVDAKPAAGAATVEEGAQKADEGTEDDCHSQNRPREEDYTEDCNEVEESQEETSTITH